jgi:hypothetical protein
MRRRYSAHGWRMPRWRPEGADYVFLVRSTTTSPRAEACRTELIGEVAVLRLPVPAIAASRPRG